MYTLLLLWLITGGAISLAIMMHYWLPDPPPDVFTRFIKVLVAGALGGVASGYLVHGSLASSDLMPGIVAAAAGGIILSGFVAALGSGK